MRSYVFLLLVALVSGQDPKLPPRVALTPQTVQKIINRLLRERIETRLYENILSIDEDLSHFYWVKAQLEKEIQEKK